MITFSVCLETVFTSLSVGERIRKIREAGYTCVEFWHPEGTWDGKGVRTEMAKVAGRLRKSCQDSGVTLNDFALHAWDGSIGGSPVRPGDRTKYIEQVRKMIAFAKEAGCTKGITLSGTVDPSLSRREMRANLEEALGEAAAIAHEESFTLLLEPLNTIVDHPGYYLDSSDEAAAIIETIKSPHLKLLYDVYHMQIMEGNLTATIEKHIAKIGHFHSAGVPGRGELFGTEVNYQALIRRLEGLGYAGTFGLEYFPKIGDHTESLKRTLEYLRGGI